MLEKQAQLFSTYLIGESAQPEAVRIYTHINNQHSYKISEDDLKILTFMTTHPRTIPYIDAYLAIFRTDSEVRHRLFIMFAVLEASPDYWRFFLPQGQRPLFIIKLAFWGSRSVWRLLVGIPTTFVARHLA